MYAISVHDLENCWQDKTLHVIHCMGVNSLGYFIWPSNHLIMSEPDEGYSKIKAPWEFDMYVFTIKAENYEMIRYERNDILTELNRKYLTSSKHNVCQ